MNYSYDFRIADLLIRVITPIELNNFFELTAFSVKYDPNRTPDAQYTIDMLPKQWQIRGNKLTEENHNAIYAWEGELHRYYYWNIYSTDRFVLLRTHDNNHSQHTIYLQADDLERIIPKFRLSAFLSPEQLLLKNRAFILHSSVINWQENGILFTGPSGIGKSTQAQLWAQLEGASIINGDRAILRRHENCILAHGSPYAGTSGIYRNQSVPLQAIVVLSQATENHLVQLSPASAFQKILSETTTIPWDNAFMSSLTDLLLALVQTVPVYHLACLPDKSAVNLLKQTLLGEI